MESHIKQEARAFGKKVYASGRHDEEDVISPAPQIPTIWTRHFNAIPESVAVLIAPSCLFVVEGDGGDAEVREWVEFAGFGDPIVIAVLP